MKRFTNLLTLTLALTLAASLPARAQVPVEDTPPLVNQYLNNRHEAYTAAWWNTLGPELTLSLVRPDGRIDAATLQNIIYFASNHGDKVRLDAAAPLLLEVYRTHGQESYRTMAMAALYAIGEPGAMKQLARARKHEPSEKLRKLTLAALTAYAQEN